VDARHLDYPAQGSADAVLPLGTVYHLVERLGSSGDCFVKLAAVLNPPKESLFAAAVLPCFASLDRRAPRAVFFQDPEFRKIVSRGFSPPARHRKFR